MVVMLNGDKRTIKNVSICEVFFVAGQFNVQMCVGEEIYADEEYPVDEKLRIFAVDRPEQDPEVFKECDGWQSANKNNIKYFSAVGYHVGAKLRKRFLCTRGKNIRGNAENIDFELVRQIMR